MRIIFVRHGDPNYELNCLTPLGHKQAAAAALRLKDEGIEKIYSSSAGRAVETAEYTAKLLGLDIESHDYMREIGWGPRDNKDFHEGGHPWYSALKMISMGDSVSSSDWTEHRFFKGNQVTNLSVKAGNDFDALLETLGYKREGKYYRVTKEPPYKTIAVFSHGGFSSAVIAHLFNLTFPYVCSTIIPDMTAITVAHFSGKVGELIAPRFEIANDSRHIAGVTEETVFGI